MRSRRRPRRAGAVRPSPSSARFRPGSPVVRGPAPSRLHLGPGSAPAAERPHLTFIQACFPRGMDARRRDAGLVRLRRLTLAFVVGAGGLVALFAGLAAKAFPGRGATRTTTPPPRRTDPKAPT